jgi:putative ABC transport system permease protein
MARIRAVDICEFYSRVNVRGLQFVKERSMGTLLQDIRYGARILMRFPGVTLAALLALALGTGVNTALFSIVNAVLLAPLPFPDSHELVQVWRTEMPRLQYGSVSYPRYVDWRARNRVFEESGVYGPEVLTLTGGDAPEQISTGRATASFFRTLAAPPLAGRYFTDDEDRPGGGDVIVLGEQFWRARLGGDPKAIGSTLTLNGRPHTVIGIAPAAYREMWRRDTWVPLAMTVEPLSRGRSFLLFVGRLRDGITLDAARLSLQDLAAEMARDHPEDKYGFHALTLHEVLTQGPRQALWILLGATAVVLLIACANVSNLLLARSIARQREMAVRTALGAGRGRLLRQLLTETVLLSLAGGLSGLLLATGLLRVFALLAPANFPRLGAISLDLRVLAFSMAVACLAGILAGVLPGWQVARAQPSDALREGSARGATSAGARAMSRALVVSELALAVILVAAAGLTVRSLQALLQQDLGLRPQGVMTFTVSLTNVALDPKVRSIPRIVDFVSGFEERLRALPGVSAVGAINMLPIAQTGSNGGVRVPDRVIPPEESPLAEFRVVTPGYFEAVGISIVAGRAIDGRDRASTQRVAVISETLARQLWPGESPTAVVGRLLGHGWDESGDGNPVWREIVGISRDVRSRRPDAPPDADTYVPHAQFSMSSMTYTVRVAGPPEGIVPAVRHELAAIDPQLPLANVRTFDEVIAGATRTSRLYSGLTTLFGFLAAALAILGIYSVMSCAVAQRVREMAIRSALGASRQGLLSMVLREGFVMSLIGIAVGLAGALGMSQVMGSLLYQVSPRDPLVFTATAVVVSVAAVLGYLVPALRASRVDAAVALRSE